MTTVLDLNTGENTHYTLSPWEAVRAAYAQRERRNFNTWTYDDYNELVKVIDSVREGTQVVTCGNQSALCRTGEAFIYQRNDYEPA